ncbi:MAG: hypothetical protein ACYDGR_03625 [Candidatus Dormibacteria bacterium]
MAAPLTAAEHAAGLEGLAGETVAGFTAEMHDSPEAAKGTFAQVAGAVQEMGRIGSEVGGKAAGLRAEAADLARQGFSEAARMKGAEADALVAQAKLDLTALSAQGHALANITESVLKSSLVPPAPPSADRALARQEILQATAGLSGAKVVDALARLATGADGALTAELFGAFTERLISNANHDWTSSTSPVDTFRTLAVGRLLQHPENARRAAQVAGLSKARGGIDSARTAAQMRLK